MFFKSAVLASLSTVALAVNNLNFVYSSGDFATISGPAGGNTYGHQHGFTLTDADGKELWSTRDINGYDTCIHVTGGKDFGLTSTCWEGTYNFHCWAGFSGQPNTCWARDADNIQWDGEADDSTTFIGISIAENGWCGGPIYAGPGTCTSDDTYTIV